MCHTWHMMLPWNHQKRFPPLITYYAMRTLNFVFIEVYCNRTKLADLKITSIIEIKFLIHCWLINILMTICFKAYCVFLPLYICIYIIFSLNCLSSLPENFDFDKFIVNVPSGLMNANFVAWNMKNSFYSFWNALNLMGLLFFKSSILYQKINLK